MNEKKFNYIRKQKIENLVRKLANDTEFAKWVSLCTDTLKIDNDNSHDCDDWRSIISNNLVDPSMITGEIVFQYLAVVLANRLKLPVSKESWVLAQSITLEVFGGCQDIAEMIRNYIKDAQESGSSTEVGKIHIHSEFDKL